MCYTHRMNIWFYILIAALVLFEGIVRIVGKPSAAFVAVVWIIVGVLLVLLSLLTLGTVQL